jgi:hypothetical protein
MIRPSANERAFEAMAVAPKAGIVASGKPTSERNATCDNRKTIGRFDPSCGSGRLQVEATGPHGPFVSVGQEAKALLALLKAGAKGCTSLEVASWAYRFGAYVHDLRHVHGLAIKTQREEHEGGWHARYVLASPVTIMDVRQPKGRAA